MILGLTLILILTLSLVPPAEGGVAADSRVTPTEETFLAEGIAGNCDPETGDLRTRYDLTPPPIRHAPVVMVMDQRTGAILYGRGIDEVRVPASLTKLVTVMTALEASRNGRFPLDESLPVDPQAFAGAMAPGSSLMFLGPDQRVDGWDLLRGLAISSGNDAAVETALRVSGSIGAFSARMNELVRSLGFSSMFFEEPAGLSPGNRVTAREMGGFTRILLERWPQVTDELFALPSFSYPESRHFPNRIMRGNSIVQYNRNMLLRDYPGADGLKTGYTSAAGYNLVATAVRDDRRLIAVVLGVDAPNHVLGGRRRTEDAISILDWGFESFRTVTPAIPELDPVEVWGGREKVGRLTAETPKPMTLPAGVIGDVHGEIDIPESVWAPWSRNEPVGFVRYRLGDCVLQEIAVYPDYSLEEGSLLLRIWDHLRWWMRRWIA